MREVCENFEFNNIWKITKALIPYRLSEAATKSNGTVAGIEHVRRTNKAGCWNQRKSPLLDFLIIYFSMALRTVSGIVLSSSDSSR